MLLLDSNPRFSSNNEERIPMTHDVPYVLQHNGDAARQVWSVNADLHTSSLKQFYIDDMDCRNWPSPIVVRVDHKGSPPHTLALCFCSRFDGRTIASFCSGNLSA